MFTKCSFDKKETKLNYYRGKLCKKDHCHYKGKFRGAGRSNCNLNYKIPKDIPIIIHNGSYDIHFIINQLAEKCKVKLDCIGENMEKYINFSVPIKKKCDDSKTITYKPRFIDSFRFMPTSLPELVDNMYGNFTGVECESCTENNRCKKCKKIIEGLIKKFPSVYQF